LTNSPDRPPAKPDSDKKASESGAASKSEKTESDEPVDFQGRPESYWRRTMADARQKVKDLENEANAIVLKIADLQTQFYREDDGFKREGIQRGIQKSFYEQDKNKEELAKAKDILQDLEKEARKSGALPGWLMEK
jgi:predicted  nucleic acid-binding Zn-ribbon protein